MYRLQPVVFLLNPVVVAAAGPKQHTLPATPWLFNCMVSVGKQVANKRQSASVTEEIGNMTPASQPALVQTPRLPEAEASPIELSIVMPCLNEAETLETCIRKAQGALREHGIVGEVVIADNGSTD